MTKDAEGKATEEKILPVSLVPLITGGERLEYLALTTRTRSSGARRRPEEDNGQKPSGHTCPHMIVKAAMAFLRMYIGHHSEERPDLVLLVR